MSEKAKMLAGELYRASDEELTRERLKARQLCRQYNESAETDAATKAAVLSQLLGTKPSGISIEPLFRCDYGYNIHLGENFYANFDLIILDVCEVRIGTNGLIGPRVTLCTATHPLDTETRTDGLELGVPITIGDNVWIGAHAVINPGVTLGNNVVVASGSVVTQPFGDHVVLAGAPAKVIKKTR